ncbi:PAN domain protein [Dictyocaulus viviparus]|uniref:PAN domain protein n=1 Tax=Dictyocaulus viviparus TaxID=29172 RepID=A0A0D8Y118_DICVI|nr:PAN domain protein [Dictyocaulus viviparus]
MLQAALLLSLCSTAVAVFECSNQETTAFVRIARARLDGTPVVVSTAGHDLTCAQYCRNNIEPTTGAQRVCASFNFDGRETCYFFDDAASPAGTSQLTANPSANNFYYEKTCLPGVSAHEACTYRSFSFERMRKTILEGFVRKSVQVANREQCLSACLKEKDFVCRSVNYNYDSYLCELSTEDRRSKPTHLRMAEGAVDYYDNNCLSRQNRCGPSGGNLVFVKSTNFEIKFYDHTQSVEAQESYCLQKCLDSLNTFCSAALVSPRGDNPMEQYQGYKVNALSWPSSGYRGSVEFNPSEKNCIVSDEDTFSRADQQGQIVGKDYYEPVCVAADLSSSTCRQQSAFERFIGSSIEGEVIASAQGVTIADCISLCFQNLNCKSINYDRSASTCFIYAVGRSDANVKANPAMDYYEFNCESQFGGMALCTNEGIRFIVNTKEPYTGAIYAAERFSTCSQVVENAKQISITFPPPTVSSDCGTVIRL